MVKGPIMKDARAIPVFSPPGWLDNTAHDPKLARAEIQHLSVRLRKIGTENREVREERDGLKRKLLHKKQANRDAPPRVTTEKCNALSRTRDYTLGAP